VRNPTRYPIYLRALSRGCRSATIPPRLIPPRNASSPVNPPRARRFPKEGKRQGALALSRRRRANGDTEKEKERERERGEKQRERERERERKVEEKNKSRKGEK